MTHPAFAASHTAVITGAASGIGLAAAKRLAGLGMNVCLGDRSAEALARAAAEFDAAKVRTVVIDVANPADLLRLRDEAAGAFGDVHVLMNNAAVGFDPGKPWDGGAGWRALLDVNLFGVINGVQAFVPGMLAHSGPAVVINTGSKQGITLPPGNSAYNVSKAGLKAYTELLEHELRQVAAGRISAHLLIPGFTYTGLTNKPEKPPGAWTPDQVVDVMIDGISRGDFYLFCQDNETTRAMDEKRMAWAGRDIIENRPALSRWHPDYAQAFATHMAS
jgi:NAD(P)-dependent dehydrogenase (short-subunit alcohol dehydrogenase family)